jgi:hypothetical protein
VTALTNAVVPTLTTAGIAVGIGKRPTNTGTKPFVVIWPDGGMQSAVTMKANDGLVETWVCHCYGLTEESAAVALRRLRDAVFALHRTIVGGRLVHYPEQLSALPLSRDDDVDPPLYDLTVEWRLSTTPTT